jgi:hypothetical protein
MPHALPCTVAHQRTPRWCMLLLWLLRLLLLALLW